jgi:phosphinothricin acetyltransferase
MAWQSEPMTMSIRPANQADLSQIQAIYAHHVVTGTGTFEIDPPDAVEMAARMAKVAAYKLPYLVSIDARDAVTGYAYAAPFRERAAYDGTVEDSIYVAKGAIGQGLGRALLKALVEACRQGGIREMLAVIGDSENHASIGLHRSLGFLEVGTLASVGFKFGQYLDVVILQKSLR